MWCLSFDRLGYVHFTEGLVLGCFWVLMVGDEQIPTNSTSNEQHQQWINHVNLQPKDESLCCCSYCNLNFNRFNHVLRLEYMFYIYIYTHSYAVDIPFKYRPPNGFINTTSKICPMPYVWSTFAPKFCVVAPKVFRKPPSQWPISGFKYLVGDPYNP